MRNLNHFHCIKYAHRNSHWCQRTHRLTHTLANCCLFDMMYLIFFEWSITNKESQIISLWNSNDKWLWMWSLVPATRSAGLSSVLPFTNIVNKNTKLAAAVAFSFGKSLCAWIYLRPLHPVFCTFCQKRPYLHIHKANSAKGTRRAALHKWWSQPDLCLFSGSAQSLVSASNDVFWPFFRTKIFSKSDPLCLYTDSNGPQHKRQEFLLIYRNVSHS